LLLIEGPAGVERPSWPARHGRRPSGLAWPPWPRAAPTAP